jgi:hypothetical protein
MKKLSNMKKSISIICLSTVAFFVFGFSVKAGNDPVASNTKIVHGKTSEVKSKTEFNSGEEIYIYMPLKKPPLKREFANKVMMNLEADGQDIFGSTFMLYTSEESLTYFSFALAIDPKYHYGEWHMGKESSYARALEALSKLPVGKHKITFGIRYVSNEDYSDKMSLTINVTEEGQKIWTEWAKQLAKKDADYVLKKK